MDKLAQIRESEVRGVLAAFVDGGLLKVASAEEFDKLAGVVAENCGYDYDINTIAGVTNAVINGTQEKTASEEVVDPTVAKAALGELLMMKVAGEVDDATFAETAGELISLASK